MKQSFAKWGWCGCEKDIFQVNAKTLWGLKQTVKVRCNFDAKSLRIFNTQYEPQNQNPHRHRLV